MKSLIIFSLLFIIICSNAAVADVYVRGYTKSNGTYVAPYYRSNPNSNFNDNWSTKPNVNPYTNQSGTRVMPPIQQDNSSFRTRLPGY
jgi:hypothetical protein